jgi:RNA polymerase sigma-70 factor (ECF subfamily)
LRGQPLEDPDKLARYLAQTARFLARSSERVVRRQKTVTGQQEMIEGVADPEADPVEASQSDALARAVRHLLKEIPNVRDREILVRTYLRDEDRDQICRELGIDEDHYRRVVSRARGRFRALLEKRLRVSDF